VLSEILLITLYRIPVGDRSAWEVVYASLKHIANPLNASLIFATGFMLLCWSVGYVLDKKGIYIKV